MVVDMDTFIEWNPSLSFDEDDEGACILEEGYGYCVRKDPVSPRPRPTTTTGPSGTVTSSASSETGAESSVTEQPAPSEAPSPTHVENALALVHPCRGTQSANPAVYRPV